MNNPEKKHHRESSRGRKYKQIFVLFLLVSVIALGYRFAQNSVDQNQNDKLTRQEKSLPQSQLNTAEIASDEVSKNTQRALATEADSLESDSTPSIKLKPQALNDAQVNIPSLSVQPEPPSLKNSSTANDVSELQKQEVTPQLDLKNADESLFRFEFGLSNSRIDSQDQLTKEKAIFLSDLNMSLQMDLLFPVDQQFQLFGRAKYNGENYSQLKKGSKIEDPKIGLFLFGIGTDYVCSEKLNAQIFIGPSQRVFIRSVAASQFEFVKVWTPEVSLDASYNAFKNERISINVGAGLKQVFSAQADSFSTQSGSGYSINVSFMRKYKGVPIKMALEYATDNIGSNIASQKRQEGRIVLGVDF
jgi:hypothetical protein